MLKLKKTEPFLFRFKKSAMSPSRLDEQESEEYDHSLDMTMVIRNGVKVAAIESSNRIGTKKADMEKGEDQKDSLMWG